MCSSTRYPGAISEPSGSGGGSPAWDWPEPPTSTARVPSAVTSGPAGPGTVRSGPASLGPGASAFSNVTAGVLSSCAPQRRRAVGLGRCLVAGHRGRVLRKWGRRSGAGEVASHAPRTGALVRHSRQSPQVAVPPTPAQQLQVGPALHHPSVVEHEDLGGLA